MVLTVLNEIDMFKNLRLGMDTVCPQLFALNLTRDALIKFPDREDLYTSLMRSDHPDERDGDPEEEL